MTKKRKPLQPLNWSYRRVCVDGEDRRVTMCEIEDPATGRKWQWREQDQPGLLDFLSSLLWEWQPFARTGLRFRGNREELRLYREARRIREARGSDYPAKRVRKELEDARVITVDDNETLHWEDDKGVKKSTPIVEFDKHLSRMKRRKRRAA